jgi:hypothetical protein
MKTVKTVARGRVDHCSINTQRLMLVWLCEIVCPARRGAESARATEPRTEIVKGQKESSVGGGLLCGAASEAGREAVERSSLPAPETLFLSEEEGSC